MRMRIGPTSRRRQFMVLADKCLRPSCGCFELVTRTHDGRPMPPPPWRALMWFLRRNRRTAFDAAAVLWADRDGFGYTTREHEQRAEGSTTADPAR